MFECRCCGQIELLTFFLWFLRATAAWAYQPLRRYRNAIYTAASLALMSFWRKAISFFLIIHCFSRFRCRSLSPRHSLIMRRCRPIRASTVRTCCSNSCQGNCLPVMSTFNNSNNNNNNKPCTWRRSSSNNSNNNNSGNNNNSDSTHCSRNISTHPPQSRGWRWRYGGFSLGVKADMFMRSDHWHAVCVAHMAPACHCWKPVRALYRYLKMMTFSWKIIVSNVEIERKYFLFCLFCSGAHWG